MNGCDKKDVTSFSKQNNNFIEKLLMKWHILISLRMISGKLPQRKIAPQSRLGFGIGLVLESGQFPRGKLS